MSLTILLCIDKLWSIWSLLVVSHIAISCLIYKNLLITQWCHRAKLVASIRKFSRQEIGVTQLIDDPIKASRGGWIFGPSSPDPIFRSKDLRELYEFLSPSYKGRCTAPLLVDRKKKKIVSNESADIVRMLELANFGRDGKDKKDAYILYPPEVGSAIDETNIWVYEKLNNGVYRCGFATQQGMFQII